MNASPDSSSAIEKSKNKQEVENVLQSGKMWCGG